jgi:hypothetical protein
MTLELCECIQLNIVNKKKVWVAATNQMTVKDLIDNHLKEEDFKEFLGKDKTMDVLKSENICLVYNLSFVSPH